MQILSLVFAAICFTSAQTGPPGSGSSPDSSSQQLASVVQQQNLLHQPEVFQHAIRIINNLESAPSCHRLAAKDLLHSCQSLELNDDTQPQATLDAIKSIYAARLAVCELAGAEAAVPPTCLALTTRRREKYGVACVLSRSGCGTRTGHVNTPSYPNVSSKELRACLGALESRPQWWTSYSNARQNAVFMCNAARTEAEREHLLDSYRSMTGSSEALSDALSASARKANTILESQAAFAESISRLQAAIISDLDESRMSFRNFVQSVRQQVDEGLQSATNKFASKFSSATQAMGELESRITKSDDSLSSFQSNLNQVFDSMHDRQDDLAALYDKQTELSTSQALALHNTLSDVRDQQVESIAQSLSGLQTELQSLGQLMALMHANHISLDGRMEHFDRTLQSLQDRSTTIDDALEQHREAQAVLFSDLNAHIDASSGRITQIVESFERVLGWLPSPSSLWTMLVVFGMLWLALCAYSMHSLKASLFVLLAGAAYYGFQSIPYAELHLSDKAWSFWVSRSSPSSGSSTNLADLCVMAFTNSAVYGLLRLLLAYRRSRRKLTEEDDTTDIEEVEKKHPRYYDLPISNN